MRLRVTCLPRARPKPVARQARIWSNQRLSSTVPFIETCPLPSCRCADTPDLEIDRKKPLINTISPHSKHVVVHTGRDDWAKRIEDDKEAPNIAKELKALLGPKGPFYDATSNSVMVTNSSSHPAGSVSIFPDGDLYLNLRQYDGVYSDFIKMVLVPEDQRVEPPGRRPFGKGTQYKRPLILICGHGSRDSRCGVLGPLLRNEFEQQISRQYGDRSQAAPEISIVSHIGGHVFAGNVIIYVPPTMETHALAGKGIWYGRVEPKHVEGILKTTLGQGKLIKELYRGGLDIEGGPVRI